jgi:hypothetical protein
MSPSSAIEWALERGAIIEHLKEAILGNYHVITALVAVLDSGSFNKKMMDEVIDQCRYQLYNMNACNLPCAIVL